MEFVQPAKIVMVVVLPTLRECSSERVKNKVIIKNVTYEIQAKEYLHNILSSGTFALKFYEFFPKISRA